MSSHRTLIHSKSYDDQLAKLGDIERVDDALGGIQWALSRGAELYPTIPGTKLKVIRAEGMHLSTKQPPVTVRIFFTILSLEEVELLWIEADREVEEEA